MRQRPKSLEDEMVAIIDVGAGLCGCIIILRACAKATDHAKKAWAGETWGC